MAVLFVSCDDNAPRRVENPPGLSGTCGLPTPEPGREESLVPPALLPEGAEISNVQAERGGFVAAINVRLSVTAALEFYEKAVREAGFEVINIDNEGFEAEMYLTRKNRLASIQIRTSTCEDRSIVFITEIIPEEA